MSLLSSPPLINPAIRYSPKELSNHLERIHLYKQVKDTKKVMEGYQILLRALPEDQGEQYMQLAKDLVKVQRTNALDSDHSEWCTGMGLWTHRLACHTC